MILRELSISSLSFACCTSSSGLPFSNTHSAAVSEPPERTEETSAAAALAVDVDAPRLIVLIDSISRVILREKTR